MPPRPARQPLSSIRKSRADLAGEPLLSTQVSMLATPAQSRHDIGADHGHFDYGVTERKVLIPRDQLDLTAEELSEEITKFLTANNPNAPKNIARFNFKEKSYKLQPTIPQEAVHFHMEGYLIHRDSEEGRSQLKAKSRYTAQVEDADASTQEEQPSPEDEEAAAQGEPGAEESELNETGGGSQRLRNQFNFSERASQTFNNPPRERGTATEPPPRLSYSATATQWEIYDAYMAEAEKARLQREKQKQHSKFAAKEEDKKQVIKKEEGNVYSTTTAKSLKILERMVHQNTYHDIAHDFRYWDDASDQFKEGKGSLLPLWKFAAEKAKRKTVTSISWNHRYPDMFAVGFGSYDFMRQTSGAICCYSLKNPEFPEYVFTTESGVMAVDFHPQHASLLAVGLYDGTVMVFDIQQRVNKPIFMSTTKTGKHTDPVWQVCWQEEDIAKNLNFFSISSDGRVTLWTMSKNELQFQDVTELKLAALPAQPAEAPAADEETALLGLAGGCCFDFNPTSDHLFIVGTEEGNIHKCSKAYNSQYLETYDGHHMSVYSVRWNPYHPRVFLSCSADWTVRLWDHSLKRAVMTFDLNNAVGDVAWAPYSSTVFAAITNDGKVHVFDLNVNKYEAIAEQQVVRKARPTRIVFNQREPLLMIGDDKGWITALKLSPNLRVIQKAEDARKYREAEIEKLEKILVFAEKSEAAAW